VKNHPGLGTRGLQRRAHGLKGSDVISENGHL
jgi:hypothetical protein